MNAVVKEIEEVKPVTVQQILAETELSKKVKLIESSLKDQIVHANPLLYGTDSYKISHKQFETTGVKEIYSNFTPRFAKYLQELLGDAFDGKYVTFGIQWLLFRLHTMMKYGFFDKPKEVVIEEMRRVLGKYINQEDFSHFEALHDLGYLPVVIKTLDEGTVVPVGIPFLTIRNTLPEFEWLPNYLETLISTDLWKQLTVATIARAFKQISIDNALETMGSIEGIEWQNHDFSCRGQSGFESSAINGAAFLTSSCGTDNMASLWAAEKFYLSTNDEGLLAGSVSAGEHSVTTSGILTEQERHNTSLQVNTNDEPIGLAESEHLYAKGVLTEKFPGGIVAYVADSFDFWTFVSEIVPSLKNEILARDGKFVVRGDSGNPVDVITGLKDVDIEDVVARKFVDEIPLQKTFTVNGTVYIGLKKPKLDGKYYLPFFELIRNGFIKEYDHTEYQVTPEHVVVAAEEKGTIEVLWELFGGTITEKGYKLLDSHIGMIYGDGITVQRSQEIFKRLKAKGFASLNIVFGVGSYSLNMISRDHLGMAIKATNTIVDIWGLDVDKPIYKEPKTDSSKKSARGLMRVFKEDGEIKFADMQTREQEEQGLLTVTYKDGKFEKITTLFEIRERIWS